MAHANYLEDNGKSINQSFKLQAKYALEKAMKQVPVVVMRYTEVGFLRLK